MYPIYSIRMAFRSFILPQFYRLRVKICDNDDDLCNYALLTHFHILLLHLISLHTIAAAMAEYIMAGLVNDHPRHKCPNAFNLLLKRIYYVFGFDGA